MPVSFFAEGKAEIRFVKKEGNNLTGPDKVRRAKQFSKQSGKIYGSRLTEVSMINADTNPISYNDFRGLERAKHKSMNILFRGKNFSVLKKLKPGTSLK